MASQTITTEEMTKRNSDEELKHEAKRVVHEFATYAVWHLSLTKPDVVALRVLLNELLGEWADNGFVCGTPNCTYCVTEATTRNFRHIFRRFVGRSERGRR